MPQASKDTFRDLATRIVDVCSRMHGGDFLLSNLIYRLERLNPWTAAMPSCAHWLVWRCGFDMVTAREKIRVARALAELPLIREKFRAGELSYSKVRAITRVAETDTEQTWVEAGLKNTAAKLERLVRTHRQASRVNAPEASVEAWKYRYFECHTQEDGSLVFEGRVPAEIGAMLKQALDQAIEWADGQQRDDRGESQTGEAGRDDSEESSEVTTGDVESAARDEHGNSAESPAEVEACCCAEHAAHTPAQHDSAELPGMTPAALEARPSLSTRRADALGLLAERFLAVAPEAEDGLQSADRYMLTIHAPVTALPLRAQVDPSDPPCLEQGPVLSTETLRRIGCDAALVRVLEGGDGEPLDVGRKTRVIPPAIRRALKRRDGGCRFPGCDRTKFVDGHHIEHWADGGETRLDNLVSICRYHHGLLHEGGYSVVKRGAEFHFFRADGLRVPDVNDRLEPRELGAELGAGVALRSTHAGTGFGTGTGTGTGETVAWRPAKARGFGRPRPRRAAWGAFVESKAGY